MISLFHNLPDHSRRSLRFHVPAAVIEGLVQGVMVLFLIVARKTLGASDLLITLLTMGPVSVMLFANVVALRMVGKPKRPYLLLAAAIGRLPWLLVFFVESARTYTVILLVSFFYYLLFKPAENSILQANYEPEHRGRIFGFLSAVMLLASMAGAFLGGLVLDADPDHFRLLIPAAGLLGTGSMLLFAFLPVRAMDYDRPIDTPPGLFSAYRNFFKALTQDPAFGRIELCFLIYGFGIIMLDPLVVIFIVDELKLNYAEAATALGLVSQAAMVILNPVAGRLFDRVSPTAMLAGSVLLLMAFPLGLFVTFGIAALYTAYALRGGAMSGVNLVWNLGPIHFARGKDSTNHMGVHMTLTGVRGLLAPALGMGTYYLLGVRGAFLVSASLFLIAGLMAVHFSRKPSPLAPLPRGEGK